MAVKQYDVRYFSAKVNGKEIEFRCYTTDTRCGFCHTAHYVGWDYDLTDTKASYYNRTWERFEYESVLKRAIDKLPADIQKEVYAQIIEGKAAEEEKQAEEMVKSFEALHSALSPENKERLANSGIEIHSEEDAHAVMGLMALMNLMK
jgi:DNA-binding TFAR19-related protein (PDSD5 family)